MKNSEIESLLYKSRKLSKRIAKRVAELAEANADAAKFNAILEANPSPHYNDNEALQLVAGTKLKLQACNDVIEKLHDELTEALEEARPMLRSAGYQLGALLSPAVDQVLEDLWPTFAAHAESHRDAIRLAEKSTRYRTAVQKRQRFIDLAPGVPLVPSAAKRGFAALEAVLTEALKESPNFAQFVSFEAPAITEPEVNTAHETVETESAIPEVVRASDPMDEVRANVLERWSVIGCTIDQVAEFEQVAANEAKLRGLGVLTPEHMEQALKTICVFFEKSCVEVLEQPWGTFEQLPNWESMVRDRFGPVPA